ncbi:hypothetical protein ACUTG2_26230 [Klebsiella aerogenes]|uniref:hypothetical protein n=1 Tax=Klebsiella aerogenes TaxID=548 RepID=UPI004044DC0D
MKFYRRNPVYKISLIRDDTQEGHILILREFRNSLQAELFWTNLNLSGHVGNGGFHDLYDFFAMLEQLYILYTNNDVFVKSYDIARGSPYSTIFNEMVTPSFPVLC